jgi:citrate synthase
VHEKTKKITDLILKAKAKAKKETDFHYEPEFTRQIEWPKECIVGPGLEGAIACESKIGYVNGKKGWLIYRGYDIFDLCAYSSFEEVSYLLLHGKLPSKSQLEEYTNILKKYRHLPNTLRMLMSFPVQDMNTMAALTLGVNLMRLRLTILSKESKAPDIYTAIGSDEDSIAMETMPMGEKRAIFEFKGNKRKLEKKDQKISIGLGPCYQSIAGLATLTAAIERLRKDLLPIEPKDELSHAANLLYMLTGKVPTPVEERIMDVALILHMDHGMNASTFASLVVASTLSDIYFSIGSGIAALNGPLHGGANEMVLYSLQEIGKPENVKKWFKKMMKQKKKIVGFGHRVYKAYDPRARILEPLVKFLTGKNEELFNLYSIAKELEYHVVSELGEKKKVFPNVDYYSGLVYKALGIPPSLFPPIFAVSRVSGWTARIIEYLQNNRIFRPRAIYNGPFDYRYVSINER